MSAVRKVPKAAGRRGLGGFTGSCSSSATRQTASHMWTRNKGAARTEAGARAGRSGLVPA